MDPKTISASVILAVAASVGVVQVTKTAPQELTLKAGATSLDQAVADAAKLTDKIEPIHADLRASVVNDVYGLHWWCGAVPCPASLVAEIGKVTSKGVSATLTPTQEGDEVTYKIEVQEGVLPELMALSEDEQALLGVGGKTKAEPAAPSIPVDPHPRDMSVPVYGKAGGAVAEQPKEIEKP
jgi:hypothetical protein